MASHIPAKVQCCSCLVFGPETGCSIVASPQLSSSCCHLAAVLASLLQVISHSQEVGCQTIPEDLCIYTGFFLLFFKNNWANVSLLEENVGLDSGIGFNPVGRLTVLQDWLGVSRNQHQSSCESNITQTFLLVPFKTCEIKVKTFPP